MSKKQEVVPAVTQWYSVKESKYHDNLKCSTGKEILGKDRKPGTGDKPLCILCDGLNKAGK